MKKLWTVMAVTALLAAAAFAPFAARNAGTAAAADGYTAADWAPYNYVLSEGFGVNVKKTDIRTDLSYANDELTVSGRTAPGGVGVTFLPEVELNGLSVEFSLKQWRTNSTDKWFGVSFMDTGLRSDMFNEVPFYGKHSEQWTNAYGAGVLIGWRPLPQTGANAQPGKIKVQFNYIGITPTSGADGQYDPAAGSYNDGLLGWGSCWMGEEILQLTDANWQPLTSYDHLKLSVREFTTGGKTGYYFDLNNGYFLRDENEVVWPIKDDPDTGYMFDELDKDGSGALNETEKLAYLRGNAYSQSIVTATNWGDDFYALGNFVKALKEKDKRLYMNVLHRDNLTLPEGTKAEFVVHKVNGKAAAAGETTSLTAAKRVDDATNKIGADIEYLSLHAGVYPSVVTGLTRTAAVEKDYADAQLAINSKKSSLKTKNATPFVLNGLMDEKKLEFVGPVTATMDLTGASKVKLFKASGDDLTEVAATADGDKLTFTAEDSKTVYVLFYDGTIAGGEDGGGRISCKKGAASLLGAGAALTILFAVLKRKY
ncbi:hypothetical protein FACS1894211_10720 [Clostridia bacterium]|nr:hypothetical protein FACS1894211_10720 [Clostridia bacterium]